MSLLATEACGPSMSVGTGTDASPPVTITTLVGAVDACADTRGGLTTDTVAARPAPSQALSVQHVTAAPM